MKKLICALLIFSIILFSLTSCSDAGRGSVMTVNGDTEIDSEIFSYFLNSAYYENEFTDEQCIEYATSESLKYIAVNTRFAQMGKTLTATEKARVSNETNALWRVYGAYLTELGISKNTFFKIKQYEYFKENLRFELYDTNGTQPINEDYIKQYFTTNYVGIKYFFEELYTPVSDSEYAAMTENEKSLYDSSKENAQKRYDYISSIANYVNSGVYSMDEAFMAVTGEVSADISVSAMVIDENTALFGREHVEAMRKQSVGSAFIITNPEKSQVYLIERVDLLSSDYDFYERYRDDCLRAVSESFFTNEINSWIRSYSAVRHLSVANKCLSAVKSVDRSKYAGTESYRFRAIDVD